ncbi:MAG: hypothetical protein WCB27_22580 [Thermoguttaceae bacterium]|jgi:hypothetical protein
MKTIAWDVDDVLNDCMRTWFERTWLPAHPGCAVGYEQLVENPPSSVLGCTKAEYLESLDEFRQSEAARQMEPVPQVLQWFTEHGSRMRHVAVSAVPLAAAHLSAAWVIRHFGLWIRSFHFIPSPREGNPTPVYDRSKGEALRQWGTIDAFIDDNRDNLASAERFGIRTFCFPRPWNRETVSLAGILHELTTLEPTYSAHAVCRPAD